MSKALLNVGLTAGFVFLCEVSAIASLSEVQDSRVSHDEIVWEKIDETDGIKVYRREIPGSDLLQFKGDAIVDAPLSKVASVLFDANRAKEWMPDLVSSRIVRWTSDN